MNETRKYPSPIIALIPITSPNLLFVGWVFLITLMWVHHQNIGLPFRIKFYLFDWRATARPRQSHVIRVFITVFVAVCEDRQS